MSSTPTADRLKKVMRIALVGIRPADQVLLKGYLRVLLRLEADLEWVSANSPQVDLFMINQEFQQAESVQRLLVTQPNVPTLYIDRDELDQGKLTGNLLILPLKEIDMLSQWLFSHVGSLRVGGDNPAPTSAPAPADPINNNTTHTSSPQTLDQILANRSQANAQASPLSSQTPPSPVQAPTAINPPPAQVKHTLVAMLKTIQQRQDSLFALKQADNVIAYINPKFQRAWVVDANANLATDWALVSHAELPTITQQHPIDLVQWLWEKSVTTPTPATALLQPTQGYRLTSWLKPLEDEHRHDTLKIQGLLESRDSTLDEIISTAQVSREFAMRAISGLIVAGLMTPEVYANLPTVLASTPDSALPSRVAPQGTTSPAHTMQSTSTLASPAQIADTPSSTISPETAAQDDGMKGFLSKLRRKLGL